MTSARKIAPAMLAGVVVIVATVLFFERQTTPAGAPAEPRAGSASTTTPGATSPDAASAAPDAASADGRARPDSAASARSARDAPLPTERVLLRNGTLDAGAAARSLRSEAFLDDLRRLGQEASQSAAATTMTADYREALEAQLRGLGVAAYPDALACGVSVCMGRLDGGADGAALERWWNDLVENGTVPHSIALRHVVDDGRGGSEVRFLLVTDPGTGSVVVPPAPPERPPR